MKILNCGQSAGKASLKQITDTDAYYIVGFSDGEGSLNVSFKVRDDYKYGIKITCSFNISQKDRDILEWIQSKLGVGTIRSRSDGVHYFEVTSVIDLICVVLPFFRRYPLKVKSDVFKIFSQIVDLVHDGVHRTPEGILEIYKIRQKIKVKRKRKYSLNDVIDIIESKRNPQRLYAKH